MSRFFIPKIMALFSLLLLSCSGANQGTDAVSGTPHMIAESDLPDDSYASGDYRFALLPLAGWTYVEGDEAQMMGPDVQAGGFFVGPPPMYGAVVVEHIPGMTIEQLAENLVAAETLESARETSRMFTQFGEYPAVQQVFEGLIEGRRVRRVRLSVIRDDYAYELQAWAVDSVGARTLTAFFRAFRFLPGEIEPHWDPGPSSVAGQHWRIQNRRFESAATGLYVGIPEGYRFWDQTQIEDAGLDFEVVVELRSPSMFVAVSAMPVPPSQRGAFYSELQRDMAANVNAPITGDAFTLEINGAPVSFGSFRSEGMEFLVGVFCGDTHCANTMIWSAQGNAERARQVLAEIPPDIGFYSAEELVRIRSELRGGQASYRSIGSDFSLRNGVFTHFDSGLIINVPNNGFWSLGAGRAAREMSQNALVTFAEQQYGWAGFAMAEEYPQNSNEICHSTVLQFIEAQQVGPTTSMRLGQFEARRSNCTLEGDAGRPVATVVTTVARGSTCMRLLFLNEWPGVAAQSLHLVDDFLNNIEVSSGPLPIFSPIPGNEGIIDHRFGFRVQLPGTGWNFRRREVGNITDRQSYMWTRGEDMINVVAAYGTLGGDEAQERLVNPMIRLMESGYGMRGQPSPSGAVSLGGRPAQSITLTAQSGVRIYLNYAIFERTAYIFVTTNQDLLSTFSFVE